MCTPSLCEMPGSIAESVQSNAASASSHCALSDADGEDTKTAATREPAMVVCEATSANGKNEAGDTASGEHAKENGKAPEGPSVERTAADETLHRGHAGADESPGTEAPNDKGATPETTPAASDATGDSPARHSQGEGSPASAKGTSTANRNVEKVIDSTPSSAGVAPKTSHEAEQVISEDAANPKAPTSEPAAIGGDGATDSPGLHQSSIGAAAAQSTTSTPRGELDDQLVASLIAAAAGNSVHANGDTGSGSASVPCAAFALSDASLTAKREKEPSVEAGLAMATLLGLGGHGRSKSDDATGSDDDDAASSSRQDAGSDVEDVASDGIKVPGKPGRKKKRDGEAGGDKDEDGDEAPGKSAQEGDASAPKPRGKKSKKQQAEEDKNLSREERKMMAIMRQFELMEKKEQAKHAPATPRAEGRGEDGSEGPDGTTKKRRDFDDDDDVGVNKRPKGQEDEATSSPRAPQSSAMSKARGRPQVHKMTAKQKIKAEKEAAGLLTVLRSHKVSHDQPKACLPRAATLQDLRPCTLWQKQNEYDVIQKSLRFSGKKSYCWIHAVLADLTEYEPYSKGSQEWLPAERKARLNPNRRNVDKRRFPVIKSHLARWAYDCELKEKAEDKALIAAAKAAAAARQDIKYEHIEDTSKTEESPKTAEITEETANVKVEVKVEDAAASVAAGAPDVTSAEVSAENMGPGTPSAMTSSSIKTETSIPRIPRREQPADVDRQPTYPGPERMRVNEPSQTGQRITTGYGSLAISIPVGGSQHASQYSSWDQRARGSDASPLVKNDPGNQDLGGNRDQRRQRGTESPGWIGKRDGPGPPPMQPLPAASSTKIANAQPENWDRGRDRSEGRSSKSEPDQEARWQRGKDSLGHWAGKRDGSGPPMPSSPRVVDAAGSWAARNPGRHSAWDKPPDQVGPPRDGAFTKEPERDTDRAGGARGHARSMLTDMREVRREPSPPSLRGEIRRRGQTPPRSIYGGDPRDRGMDMAGGGGGGGLSRERLRREREEIVMGRDREPHERDPPPPRGFMRSEIVRSEIVRSEIRATAPERASDSPRSRGMGAAPSQWDLGPRARSPRPLDRYMMCVMFALSLHLVMVPWQWFGRILTLAAYAGLAWAGRRVRVAIAHFRRGARRCRGR